MYKLQIKLNDWLLIGFFGVVFGVILGASLYLLINKNILDGVLLGGLHGGFIALLSVVLISLGNKIILPNIQEKYWNVISFILSFMAGFVGSLLAVFGAINLQLEILEGYFNHFIFFSILTGMLTYLVGYIMYLFVNSRNNNEFIQENYDKLKLDLLQSQLNPHFLFNSINSIAELIYQDPKKADIALMKLGDILRKSIKEQLTVALKDELQVVNDYVYLQNIRFKDQITLKTTNNIHHTTTLFVPKFCIQLLIENAIKHNNLQNSLHLEIKIVFEHAHLIIHVKDNGKGFEQLTYNTGLTNLTQRIKMLHNGEFIATSIPNQGANFTIILKENYENTSY